MEDVSNLCPRWEFCLMLQSGQNFPPELGKTTGKQVWQPTALRKVPMTQIPLGCCDNSDGVSKMCGGLCVACSSPPLTSHQCAASIPGPPRAILSGPIFSKMGLIPRSKDTACPCTGKLQLLVVPLGSTTAYRSNALFLFLATHPFNSLNNFTHPSHVLLGLDFILFKHLHNCSIRALLFESKNVQLE